MNAKHTAHTYAHTLARSSHLICTALRIFTIPVPPSRPLRKASIRGTTQCVFVSTFILFSPRYAQSGLGKFFTGKRPLVSTTASFSARFAFRKMWRIKFFARNRA